MHLGRDDDAEPRAGVDVDVRIDAALADQPQLRQLLQQRRADLRALADEHQRLGVAQPLGERPRGPPERGGERVVAEHPEDPRAEGLGRVLDEDRRRGADIFPAGALDADLEIMDEMRPVNQDGAVVPILWMGNLVCSNRSQQGVIKA